MSLRLRLTLTYALLMTLILGVFSIVLYVSTRRTLEAEMDRRLHVRASQVELTIWPGTTSLTAEDLTSAKLNLAPLSRLNAPNVYVQVLGRDGGVVATSDNLRDATLPVEAPSLDAALRGEPVLDDVSVGDDQTVRIFSVPITADRNIVGVLQVGQSRQPLQDAMDGLRMQLQILGIAALALSGALGWLVAHRGLRDLFAMAQQAAEIAARRDFGRRLQVRGRRDEVGQLAQTIDQLLATVDDTLRTHREFVADTSHELRNPLLAVRTNLGVVGRITDRDERDACLREAREQVERMTRLVSDLLVLAQVEAGQVVERRPVALYPLLERVVAEAKPHADGRQIQVAGPADIQLVGDEGRLTQVFANLVDNALKYTLPNGAISVRLDREDGWASICVADTGVGIAPEHLPHVFDRFYRVRKARAESNGTGLGLAIVKHLTEAHGGRVSVDSEPGRGSRFTVRLPLHSVNL